MLAGRRSRSHLGRGRSGRGAARLVATVARALALRRRQSDLDAVFLVLDRLSVDVVFIRVSTAGVELAVAVVLDLAPARDRESSGRGGTLVALKLSGWRRQNAATTLGVGDAAISEAVGPRRMVTTNTILAIIELADSTGLSTGGDNLETASVLLPWEH